MPGGVRAPTTLVRSLHGQTAPHKNCRRLDRISCSEHHPGLLHTGHRPAHKHDEPPKDATNHRRGIHTHKTPRGVQGSTVRRTAPRSNTAHEHKAATVQPTPLTRPMHAATIPEALDGRASTVQRTPPRPRTDTPLLCNEHPRGPAQTRLFRATNTSLGPAHKHEHASPLSDEHRLGTPLPYHPGVIT